MTPKLHLWFMAAALFLGLTTGAFSQDPAKAGGSSPDNTKVNKRDRAEDVSSAGEKAASTHGATTGEPSRSETIGTSGKY